MPLHAKAFLVIPCLNRASLAPKHMRTAHKVMHAAHKVMHTAHKVMHAVHKVMHTRKVVTEPKIFNSIIHLSFKLNFSSLRLFLIILKKSIYLQFTCWRRIVVSTIYIVVDWMQNVSIRVQFMGIPALSPSLVCVSFIKITYYKWPAIDLWWKNKICVFTEDVLVWK